MLVHEVMDLLWPLMLAVGFTFWLVLPPEPPALP